MSFKIRGIKYLPIEEAERIMGKRLDRRRRYFLSIINSDKDEVCFIGRWTQSCSGCFEPGEYGEMAHLYPYDEKSKCRVGSGCYECGYTGKRRHEWPIPAWTLFDEELRELSK